MTCAGSPSAMAICWGSVDSCCLLRKQSSPLGFAELGSRNYTVLVCIDLIEETPSSSLHAHYRRGTIAACHSCRARHLREIVLPWQGRLQRCRVLDSICG